jgi:hypothetical protein
MNAAPTATADPQGDLRACLAGPVTAELYLDLAEDGPGRIRYKTPPRSSGYSAVVVEPGEWVFTDGKATLERELVFDMKRAAGLVKGWLLMHEVEGQPTVFGMGAFDDGPYDVKRCGGIVFLQPRLFPLKDSPPDAAEATS